MKSIADLWSGMRVDNQETPTPSFTKMRSKRERRLFHNATDNFVTQAHDLGFTQWIFLDRSARVLAPLFNGNWDKNYPQTDKPRTNFAQIGKKTLVTDAHIAELRSMFGNQFDGERILIVDEYSCTGGTKDVSKELMHEACPNADFEYAAVFGYPFEESVIQPIKRFMDKSRPRIFFQLKSPLFMKTKGMQVRKRPDPLPRTVRDHDNTQAEMYAIGKGNI